MLPVNANQAAAASASPSPLSRPHGVALSTFGDTLAWFADRRNAPQPGPVSRPLRLCHGMEGATSASKERTGASAFRAKPFLSVRVASITCAGTGWLTSNEPYGPPPEFHHPQG